MHWQKLRRAFPGTWARITRSYVRVSSLPRAHATPAMQHRNRGRRTMSGAAQKAYALHRAECRTALSCAAFRMYACSANRQPEVQNLAVIRGHARLRRRQEIPAVYGAVAGSAQQQVRCRCQLGGNASDVALCRAERAWLCLIGSVPHSNPTTETQPGLPCDAAVHPVHCNDSILRAFKLCDGLVSSCNARARQTQTRQPHDVAVREDRGRLQCAGGSWRALASYGHSSRAILGGRGNVQRRVCTCAAGMRSSHGAQPVFEVVRRLGAGAGSLQTGARCLRATYVASPCTCTAKRCTITPTRLKMQRQIK